jgi:hypothetical protein
MIADHPGSLEGAAERELPHRVRCVSDGVMDWDTENTDDTEGTYVWKKGTCKGAFPILVRC